MSVWWPGKDQGIPEPRRPEDPNDPRTQRPGETFEQYVLRRSQENPVNAPAPQMPVPTFESGPGGYKQTGGFKPAMDDFLDQMQHPTPIEIPQGTPPPRGFPQPQEPVLHGPLDGTSSKQPIPDNTKGNTMFSPFSGYSPAGQVPEYYNPYKNFSAQTTSMNQAQQAAQAGVPGKDAAAPQNGQQLGRRVRIRHPRTGEVREVDANHAQHYISKGGSVV